MFRKIYSVGIASVMLLGVAIAQQGARNIPIKPNKEVQSFMLTWCSPDLEERRKLFPDETTESELKLKLLELQEKAGGGKELVEQLLYFRVHAKSTMEAMMPVVAMERLGISADEKVSGILPSLETDDKSVLSEAHEWLTGVDYDRKTKSYDFGRYEKVIREKKSNVPQGLVKYMYTKSPDAALTSMVTVYLDKDDAKTLVDQVKSEDEAQAVDRLSKRPEWWAKLYAAEKMKQNPKLRKPELVERLKKSENPVVSATIQEIEDEQK